MKKNGRTTPRLISNDIFRSYSFSSIDQHSDGKNDGVIIDDGLFEFVFLKENDISVIAADQVIELPNFFIVGNVPLPSRMIIPDSMNIFAIKIQPWASTFFKKIDSSPIVELSEKNYPGIVQLHHQLFNAQDFEEQVNCVEKFFLKQTLPNLQAFEISKRICEYIYHKKGNVVVKDIVALFPQSRQKLNQLFLAHTGNSIKKFATHTRLREIMCYHMQYPDQSLTSIAYEFGYFDQSHFIKDMKKITGVTPRTFSRTTNAFFDQIESKRL